MAIGRDDKGMAIGRDDKGMAIGRDDKGMGNPASCWERQHGWPPSDCVIGSDGDPVDAGSGIVE
jgi:hypothetical protein